MNGFLGLFGVFRSRFKAQPGNFVSSAARSFAFPGRVEMGTGGEYSRADDFALGNSFLLGDDPLDGLAADSERGCHPMIEVKLALPLLVVNVGVDEPGKRGAVPRLHHSGALRNLDCAFPSDRLDSFALDHNDGVFHRLTAATVNQKSHFQDRQPFLSHRGRRDSQTSESQE